MNNIRTIAQVVGFVTLGLLALYGAVTFLGGAGPFGLAVQADDNAPAAPAEAAGILGGTITPTMNYQGFLRDPDGSLTTGAYTITARIYNSEKDGTSLYTTTVPNVNVRDGLFNIVLGDDPEDPELLAETLSDMPRYIGIDLNDGAGELIPRQRLHAVPWAMTANTLVDDAPAQSVQGLSSSGNITLTGGSDMTVSGGIEVGADIGVSGGIEVGGDIDVTGNITFGGSLGGLRWKVYVASHDSPEEECATVETIMEPVTTSFCVLRQVDILEWVDSSPEERVSCEIYWGGDDSWVLKADAKCEASGNNPRVYCSAMCLTNLTDFLPQP